MMVLAGCSTIDEDLSDCGEEAKMDYELKLVTNMTTEIQTQLTAETDISVAAELHEHLSDIFTDFAHDVDLSFYNTVGDSLRLHHDEHIMDANQQSYTLFIPRQKYMHLAVANIVDNPLVDLKQDERCHTSQIEQITQQSHHAATAQPDTIDSHSTGLFTARQMMEMIEGINQTFNVHLYMANCAAAVVLDPRGYSADGIQVYMTGFATAFNVADSIYTFSDSSPIVRTVSLQQASEDGNPLCFCSVNFPSREPELVTRSIVETEEPFIANPDEEALWEIRVYVPHENGTKDEYVLGIKEPLRAGQFRIIKVHMTEDGRIESDSPNVGVSVTLDWKPGGMYNPEL